MTILNITQKELQTAADNDTDKIGNKIKLKSTSLTNTRNNIMNIPIISSEIADQEEKNVDKKDEGYTLNAEIINFESIQEGGSKPINVKEKMLERIKKHRQEEFDIDITSTIEEPNIDELSVEENNQTNTFENSSESLFANAINNMERHAVEQESETAIPIINQNMVESTTEVFDINKKFDEITLTRKEVENIRKTADNATQAALKSDEELRKSVEENNSIETQLKDAEVRSIEIEKELIEALKKQSTTLKANREKYNKIIIESNSRREQNETKIIEIQNNTSKAREELMRLTGTNADREKVLKAIFDMENSFQEDEPSIKKVA